MPGLPTVLDAPGTVELAPSPKQMRISCRDLCTSSASTRAPVGVLSVLCIWLLCALEIESAMRLGAAVGVLSELCVWLLHALGDASAERLPED